LKSKNILVTGGAGFIGTHLCKSLMDKGNYVYCLDNFYTGSIENIRPLFEKKNFEYVEHDIIDPIDIDVDVIYNLACPASPVHYQTDPVKTIKTSIYGAINMLELSKKTNARVLQASTSEVYGDPTVHPQPENYVGSVNPIGPRACYDEGKRAAETLFFDYHRQYGLEIRVARIFNTYGPLMATNDGRVVSNFIVQALKNEPITIYGNGNQTRSFCYVDDMVNGLISLMNQDIDTGPVNLGNSHETKIKDIAIEIIELSNSKSEIIYKDLPIDDPVMRRPDLKKAIELIKWHPLIDKAEGLRKTMEYFKKTMVDKH
jgi:UDP-glucuronate decarboxylase